MPSRVRSEASMAASASASVQVEERAHEHALDRVPRALPAVELHELPDFLGQAPSVRGDRRRVPLSSPRSRGISARPYAPYFSTPVTTTPCMKKRWVKKKITTGTTQDMTVAAWTRATRVLNIPLNIPRPTLMG